MPVRKASAPFKRIDTEGLGYIVKNSGSDAIRMRVKPPYKTNTFSLKDFEQTSTGYRHRDNKVIPSK